MIVNRSPNPHFRLFGGACLISFSPVFVQLTSVAPTTSGFYRTLFGGLVLLVYIVVKRERRQLPVAAAIAVALAAVFFALDLWFWHRSVLLIGPGLSTLLANFQVFVMIAAGALLFRERPGRIQLLAAPLAVAGLALILGDDWTLLGPGFRTGVVLGLLTALSYAGYLLCLRRARTGSDQRVPVAEVAAVSMLTAFLLSLAAVAEGTSLMIPTAVDLGWLLAYGILAHAFGWILITSSLAEVTAAEVGIALLLQPALSLVWDVIFFGRAFAAIEVLGVIVTLAAIFLGSQRRVP
ncbi:MAG TPA: DMT family transporter [Gammaproteobacteria bacterium]|jgi:drug/metabolite transporter (DMT)-like permease